MSDASNENAEDLLCESWSIGRLRPWLQIVAERELPAGLHGRVDASDVVQQTLLKAWQGESNFKGNTHEQRLAWLRAIIKNTIRDRYRCEMETQRRGEGAERAETDAFPAEDSGLNGYAVKSVVTASGELIGAEESLALAATLAKLPDEQQRVIRLRHFDAYSYAQIAEQIGKSEPAVRMLWIRALRNLRKN